MVLSLIMGGTRTMARIGMEERKGMVGQQDLGGAVSGENVRVKQKC